jgi:hypothetical protein
MMGADDQEVEGHDGMGENSDLSLRIEIEP